MTHSIMLFFIVCVTASISFTVTEAKVFSALRDGMRRVHPKLGELFACSYCLGHWVAFGLVAIYQPRLFFSQVAIFDYFLTALVIAWFSGIQTTIMSWLMDEAGK